MPSPESLKCRKSMDTKLHVAMFPWLAFGHIIPFLQLANDLAKRGHRISLLLPTTAQLKLKHMNLYPQLITFHSLNLPRVEGLPPGAETTADTKNLDGSLTLAFDGLQDEVKTILLQMEKPNLVFYDFAYWIPELVSEMGCKTVKFAVYSPTILALSLVLSRSKGKGRAVTAADFTEPPPGFPSDSKVVLREHEAYQASRSVNLPSNRLKVFDRVVEGMKRCDAIAMRACDEMEGQYCNYIATELGKGVYCTGPLLPEPKEEPLEDKIARWIEKFEPNSVIFCAFGSEVVLGKEQFQELVLGLELTGLPFLVAVRPPEGSSAIEDALPEGFEERVKGKAMVHGGWVPQSLILRHKAVGYFVNHGGSASMWESLASHCRIIVAPNRADFAMNARLMAEEFGAAVEVEKDENGRFSRENLCNAIKSVMGENIKEEENHKKWRDLLLNPGFADNYIDSFIHELYELLAQ